MLINIPTTPESILVEMTTGGVSVVDPGFNTWLASLPDDDWGDSFESAIPIHWDAETGEWIED